MVDYTSLAATAKRLIEKNGRTVTITKMSQTPADPAKPHRARNPAADTSVTPTAVVVPFEREQVDGSNVMVDDKMVLVAQESVSGVDLQSFDRLTDGSDEYDIVKVKKVNPGPTSVVYMIQVRR